MSYRWSSILILVLTSVASAIPNQSFDQAVEKFQHSEVEKQLWLKPGKREFKGDFVARLKKEAAAGNVESESTLALCLWLGFGTDRNVAKAVEWYQKAAAAGHAGAQNNLGQIYDSGTGVSLDHAKAFELYLAAARQGLEDAEFNVALDYAKGEGVAQDWEQARRWYEKAADHGMLTAQTNLGNIYLLGRGVPVDLAKARSYLQKPADAGIGPALLSLGVSYDNEHKAAEAAAWYKRAAEAGAPNGEYAWASMLATGAGVKQDFAEALKWARKAANNPVHIEPDVSGDAHALIADILSAGPVEQNGAETFREATLAASMGSGSGENALGVCYYRGLGVKADLQKAAECYRRGAELKNTNASANLGQMLERGRGIPKDPAEAAKYYRVGVQDGNPLATAGLGRLYLDGLGVEQNLAEAVKWLGQAYAVRHDDHAVADDYCRAVTKLAGELETVRTGGPSPKYAEAAKWYRVAAEIGQPYAQYRLGVFYRDGTGVETDLREAVKWLRLAADRFPEFQKELEGAERQLNGAAAAIPRDSHPVDSHSKDFEGDLARANALRASLTRSPEDARVKKDLAKVAAKLANALEKGVWVTQSLTEAAAWYRLAAEAGEPQAEFRLGLFYRDGTGVDTNLEEAAKWLRLAAKDSPNDRDIKDALQEAERLLKKSSRPSLPK